MLSLDIFRPFVGYREVRLVSKESKHVSVLLVTVVGLSNFGYLVDWLKVTVSSLY